MMRQPISSYKSSTAEGIRVVHALMMREVKTRFGESHLGFAWLFIEPLLFIIPIVVFWSFRGHTQHGLPLVEFILTGYPPFILWRNCVARSRAAISGNSGLLYHRMITPARIVLARCLLEVAASFISIGITYTIFIYIQWAKAPANLPYFLMGWIYMAAIGWACAIFLSALTEVSVVMAKITGTLTYLMLAVGGVFYMVEWMPNSLHPYLECVPTVQAFELIRGGYFGDGVKTHWSIINMIFCFLIPATLGLHILGFAREHLELE